MKRKSLIAVLLLLSQVKRNAFNLHQKFVRGSTKHTEIVTPLEDKRFPESVGNKKFLGINQVENTRSMQNCVNEQSSIMHHSKQSTSNFLKNAKNESVKQNQKSPNSENNLYKNLPIKGMIIFHLKFMKKVILLLIKNHFLE
ncbi:hypothetical protein CEXT_389501 [Caerostris extrusa]|uniref:Uncharacterized protein n=1 Tax=Caerostris extrusa TaxID=172846 RepID=A0AAV4PZA2_CAEEX|nr:hypothetical protein CEXT_389501 [Caerostris extrusa]